MCSAQSGRWGRPCALCRAVAVATARRGQTARGTTVSGRYPDHRRYMPSLSPSGRPVGRSADTAQRRRLATGLNPSSRPVRRIVDAAQRRRPATGLSPSSRPVRRTVDAAQPIGSRSVPAVWPRCAEPSALRARNVVGARIPGARAPGCVTPLRGAARSFGPDDHGQRHRARRPRSQERPTANDTGRQTHTLPEGAARTIPWHSTGVLAQASQARACDADAPE